MYIVPLRRKMDKKKTPPAEAGGVAMKEVLIYYTIEFGICKTKNNPSPAEASEGLVVSVTCPTIPKDST